MNAERMQLAVADRRSARSANLTESEMYTALDSLGALWRFRWTAVIVFAITLIIVGIVTLWMEKTYLSDSQIFVRLGRENTVSDVAASLGERALYAPPLTRDAEINSIAVMMTGKELFGIVVDKVGAERILDKGGAPKAESTESKTQATIGERLGPVIDSLMKTLQDIGALDKLDIRERAIIDLQKNVVVSTNKQTHVVNVQYESYDPQVAQEVVQTLVDAYVAQHSKMHRSDRGGVFLEQQVQESRESLLNTEDKFEAFKNETLLLSVGDQKRVLVERLAKLQNEELDVAAELQSVEAEVQRLQALMEDIPESGPISQTNGAGNEGIDGMRQELFRLQVRREELLVKFTPEHPQVKLVEQQLERAKSLFETASTELVESVEGPSRIYEGARLQWIQRAPLLDALRSKKATLETQVQQVLEELAAFNVQETQFLRLQRDMELQDEHYKRLERSWRQAQMDQEMQTQNLSNLSIVQSASFNPKPYRPNKLINLVAGVLMGGMLAIGAATLRDIRARQRVRRPAPLATPDVEVLANVPMQNERSLSGVT